MSWSRNVLLLLVLAALLPARLLAQMVWGQTAGTIPSSFTPYTIAAEDGIVVIGGNALAFSSNQGATWQMLNIPVTNTNIVRIAIFDRNTFAFQSGTSRIYITEDQGNTWRSFLNGTSVTPTFPMIFLGDPKKILCMSTQNEFVYTSNGGASFRTSSTSLIPYDFKLAADGSLRLFSRTDTTVCTAWSYDTAETWTVSSILPFPDCFSMIADPLDREVHCVINEDFYYELYKSMIFRTSDNGLTWDTTLSQTLPYLAGSSDVGCTDYFVTTTNNGVLRSTDQGQSWHSVGGPNVDPDFRNFVAADDSLLFAIDDNNRVWSTRPVSHTWKIKVRNLLYFDTEMKPCDSTRLGRIIIYPGCNGVGVARFDIIGQQKNDYLVLDGIDNTFPDTILIQYRTPGPGTSVAALKLVMEDSSQHDFNLAVRTLNPDLTVGPIELMLDTISVCDQLKDTIHVESICPALLNDVDLFGADSAAFTISGTSWNLPGDSLIVVTFRPQRIGTHLATIRVTTPLGRIIMINLRPYASPVPLMVVYDTVFARDTLLKCEGGRDTIKIRPRCAVGNITVTLTDSSDFKLLSKRTISLPQDSVIIVEYSSNGKNNINSTLTLRSPGVGSVDVPLRQPFKRAPVVLSWGNPIASDTFSFCKEVIDTLVFSSECPYSISNVHFEGPDAAKFRIVGSIVLSLPGDSALVVACTATQPGTLNADLVFLTGDGVTNRYRLTPTFTIAPFKFAPASLFAGDSIGSCIGAFDTLRLTADCPLTIKSIILTGADVSAFNLVSTAPLSLPKDSLLIVRCLPGPKGRKIAAVRIEFDDGRVVSIPLSALVVDAPIKIVPAGLFVKDSVSVCVSSYDTLRLIAPCALDLKSVSIQGADAGLFTIEGAAPGSLPADSIVIIRITPNGKGTLSAYLRIEAVDGRTWNVPLTPVVVESHVRISPAVLFETDSTLSCGLLLDTLLLSADCPITFTSVTITGADAASFTFTGSAPLSLPQDSIIVVRCEPDRIGMLDAVLTLVAADGRTWSIPLKGASSISPIALSRTALFDLDSIEVCESVRDTVTLSTLCPTDIAEVRITGAGASAFLADRTQLQLPSDNTIVVTCQPTSTGSVDAVLHVRAADGRTWDLPMSVYVKQTPVSVSRQSLFARDSFTICEQRRDTIYIRAGCPIGLGAISISGADQQSFSIVSAGTTLPQDSAIIIECTPNRAGALDGVLEIRTADGRSFTIPLTPYTIDFATLSFEPLVDFATDTLGGDVRIPISAIRSGGQGEVAFTLHYDPATLVFDGVYDATNTNRSIVQNPGIARVQFTAQDRTALEARFSYFPADVLCTDIRIDSIAAIGQEAACLQTLTTSVSAEICGIDGCGNSILVSFLRTGDIPQLSITPNPSNGSAILRADRALENAQIAIVDAYGKIVKTFQPATISEAGVLLESQEFASGVYAVRVHTAQMQAVLRWVIAR